MQDIDNKTEHQSEQNQTIHMTRPQILNQTYICLPSSNNNINTSINANVDQITSGFVGIDDSLSNAVTVTQSTSYNQKTFERMRQDEGK